MPKKTAPRIQPAFSQLLPQRKSHLRWVLTSLLAFAICFAATSIFLQSQENERPCANSRTCLSDLTERIDNAALGMFEGKEVVPPKITPPAQPSTTPSLGETNGTKHIYVDLSTQTLYAYQGTTLFLKTFVSTGKWNRTPDGNFHIWEKLISTRMAGGEGADAYDLPNVPYVMYFYSDFGLHGTYWHDNFGHTMSHGCVNMRSIDAKTLFEWADGPSGNTPGTAVSVCDQITKSHQCIQSNPLSS